MLHDTQTRIEIETSVLTAAHTTQLIIVANYWYGSNNVEMKSSSSGHRAYTGLFDVTIIKLFITFG